VRGSIVLAAFALLAGSAVVACSSAPEEQVPDSEAPRAEAAPAEPAPARIEASVDAAALFATHCAVCHGEDGRGDGPASPWLFPPARDLGVGRFRLVSTENGVPSDADLVATLRRGLPGSAMPAWDWLGEDALGALASHVRELAADGIATDDVTRAEEAGSSLSWDEARGVAGRLMEPGPELAALPGVEDESAGLLRGREHFSRDCAACHGLDGSGTPAPRRDDDGALNWARDLTAGFLEGEPTIEAIGHRIRAGMPGSGMPAFANLTPEETADLALYVQSLVGEGALRRLVHRRERLDVARLDALPAGPDDPAWAGAPGIEVVLAPLWWNDEAVTGALVQAFHDGEELALRVSWADGSQDDRFLVDGVTPDGLAVQLASDPGAPLFGMGSAEHPTELWHWRAMRPEDSTGALDLIGVTPHAPGELEDVRLDVPLYRPAVDQLDTSEEVDTLRSRGVGEAQRHPGGVVSEPARTATGWSVVLRRGLVPADELEAPLLPGTTVQLALAIWNGAAGDTGARKSISIWQELALSP
jgi:DMSO reductase family type II enzyme heme b subunit